MTKKSPAKKTAKKNKRLTRDPAKTKAARADRHLLYERAVQCVEAEIDFVDDTFKSLRGRKPTTLREDFCGTANTSCEWVRRRKDNRAWGIDLDPDVLAWGNTHRLAPLKPHQRERIEIIQDDVLTAKTPRVDAVLAMNFSYWIFHTREQMKAYFSKVRSCLTSEGVFFLDAYGGAESMSEMEEETDHGDFTFDAFMVPENELKAGQPRLLATDENLVLPVGKKIRVLVTSSDVLHAFAMPAFGSKVDAVPGRTNETWFQIDEPGMYYGQCSELCGAGHAFMPLAIQAVPEAEFNAWVTKAQARFGESDDELTPRPIRITRNEAGDTPVTAQ